jgi:hypothetical protein
MLITQISLKTSWLWCNRCLWFKLLRSNAGLFATGALIFQMSLDCWTICDKCLCFKFHGNQAGYQATSANNSFLWYWCWSSGTSASNSNFFGYNAGVVQHLLIGQISLVKMLVM